MAGDFGDLGPPPSPCGEGGCIGDYVIKQPFLERTKREELDALASRRVRLRSGSRTEQLARAYLAKPATHEFTTSAEREAARLRSLPPNYWEFATPTELKAKRLSEQALLMEKLHAIEEADRKQTAAKVAESQRHEQSRRVAADSIRRLRSRSPGTDTADLLSLVGTSLIELQWQSKLASERRQRILRTNRRGALAQRPFTGAAVPARSGAKSTRALAAARAAAPQPHRTDQSPLSAPVPRQVATKSQGESAASKAARAVMAGSPALPKGKTATKAQQPSRFALTFNVPQLSAFSFPLLPRVGARQSPKQGSRVATRPTFSAAAAPEKRSSSAAPRTLTGFNPPVLTSQFQCQCTKPPKRKRGTGCTNPLISREVRDGVITTKRKLVCQPSKPK